MQATENILLVKPANFVFNKETETSNAFQSTINESWDVLKQKASAEFEEFAKTLKAKGVNVFVFDDTAFPLKPDAIFPNNWVSFHADGTVILYPMHATNRQPERRLDIIDTLRQHFKIINIIDLSIHENGSRYLEGTGSIIFDHDNKIAYACISPRTDEGLFHNVCKLLQYTPIAFHAYDKGGKEIYHTNVMMCIGEKFAAIYLEGITNQNEKEIVIHTLAKTGHQIIDISFDQMKNFAGNILELKTTHDKNIVALSASAFENLKSNQKSEIEKYCELVPLSIKTIETIGGGSARCMIAEIFLPAL
jgi:hypothetical protein